MKLTDAIIEKIKDMPCNEACIYAVRNFWNIEPPFESSKLLDIYTAKKNECITQESRFELLIALYNEYKETGNTLAFHFAKILAHEI